MKQVAKTKRRSSDHRLLWVTLVALVVTVASFGFAYWHTESSHESVHTECKNDFSVEPLRSADGLIIEEEADLTCADENAEKRSQDERTNLINLVSISVGVVGAGLTLVLLALFLRKSS